MEPKFETFEGYFTLTAFMRDFISDMNVGDSKKNPLKTDVKRLAKFRMTLNKVAVEDGKKFATKTEDKETLWIMRIE